uniref:Uncharacterized protein n=1 Tax=Setaria italica TaxID=4555 RepID=A0A341LZ59_SETIT
MLTHSTDSLRWRSFSSRKKEKLEVGTWGQEPLTLSSRSARRRLRSVQSLSKAAPTKKKRAKRPMTKRLTGGAGS